MWFRATSLKSSLGLLYLLVTYFWFPSQTTAQDFSFLAQQTQGVGTAFIQVEVLSPTETTGDTYGVQFTQQDGDHFYTIENLTTQTIVAENTPVETPLRFDGVEVSIDVPSGPQILDVLEVRYGGNVVDPPRHIFRSGDRQGEGGNNSTNEYAFIAGGGTGDFPEITRSENNTDFNDFEIRFEENPESRNKLVHGFNGAGTYDAPFSVWNVGTAAANTPDDDRQILAVTFDDSNNPSVFDGGSAPSDGGPGTMYDRLYIFDIEPDNLPDGDVNNDGVVNYDDFLQDLNRNGGDISSDFFSRPYFDGFDSEVISRLAMVSLNNDPNYLPPAGTTIRITTTKPLSELDRYEFTTERFGLHTEPLSLNFGNTQIRNPKTLQITVHNGSEKTLSVNDVTFNSVQFRTNTTNFSLAAGQSRSITLTFSPTTVGVMEDTLTITSNDDFFPEYRVPVIAEGLPEPVGILSIIGHLDIQTGATDVWGYVDETTGKEYAIVGSPNGVNIVEVTQPTRPRLVSRVTTIDGVDVPGFDAKTWSHYVYLVTGGFGVNRGVILDIQDPENPQLAGQFDSSHNIFITDDGIMILEVPGWRIFDLTQDPANPKLLTSGGLQNHGHDAAVINGRFFDFHGRVGTNIYDFSDPANPVMLTSILDPNIQYNHSGWTTEDGNYLFICDELARHPLPDIVVYDIRDLNNPQRVGSFGDPNATVHNLFIIGNYAITSYYSAGFRVFDISDPTQPEIAAEFDIAPDFTGENFNGTWGVYPFAPSGNIYASDRSNGLYIFRIEGLTTSVEEPPAQVPEQIVLHGNYPNPFNPETNISYELSGAMTVEISIYNVLGQRLRTLLDEQQLAGVHTVRWDGTDDAGRPVSSGIYFYKFSAGDFVETKRMLLLR